MPLSVPVPGGRAGLESSRDGLGGRRKANWRLCRRRGLPLEGQAPQPHVDKHWVVARRPSLPQARVVANPTSCLRCRVPTGRRPSSPGPAPTQSAGAARGRSLSGVSLASVIGASGTRQSEARELRRREPRVPRTGRRRGRKAGGGARAAVWGARGARRLPRTDSAGAAVLPAEHGREACGPAPARPHLLSSVS